MADDPRSTFGRKSVAHSALKGQIEAARFTDGEVMRVARPVAKIVARPGAEAREREAVFGEAVTVLEHANGKMFGRCETNGYVGYFMPDELGAWHSPTHIVKERTTLAFPTPDFRDPGAMAFSHGSRVAIAGREGRWFQSLDGWYFPDTHLAPVERHDADPVEVARRFLGVPYLWGGNSGFGIDCSGLVQAAMNACGWVCPGDSDQQAEMPGEEIGLEAAEAGDLVFWATHVAIATGEGTLVHANESNMKVTDEPIEIVLERNRGNGTGSVTRVLRPCRISRPGE